MKILDKLNLPEDIKNLDDEKLNELADDLLEKMLDLSKKRQIHFSSNLGVIHLTIALLKVFDAKKDNLVFDIGHQTYIYKMLTDRLAKIDTIRTSNGLSGFQDPSESLYDKFSAGHAATSISATIGMKIASKNENNYNVAIIGDASLSSGLSLEALEVNPVLDAPIIIVINDNNMSIGESVGSLNKILLDLRTGKSQVNFFTLMGYKYFKVDNGHNIEELSNVLMQAKNHLKKFHESVIVHVVTTKGYGYKIDTTGEFHSYYYDHDTNAKIIDSNGYYLAKRLIDFYKTNQNFIVVSPSMTYSTGFNIFQKAYPSNFIDLGIQEENAITISAGIAIKKKYRPIVVTYSTFIQRAYDQILHDVARLNLGITILLDRADLATSDGSSHMGIYDVEMLQSIPNVLLTSGMTKKQNFELLKLSLELNQNNVFCIRYAASEFSRNEEVIKLIDELDLNYKEWQIIKHNKQNKICFISYGTYYLKILEKFLNKDNVTFVNACFINSYYETNIEWIFKQNFETIIIYERINGGSKIVKDLMAYALRFHKKIKILALHYEGFISQGTLDEIDQRFNMDLDYLSNLFDETKNLTND